MAKKTATYANYELRAEDNGKIVILNAGQLMPNAKGAIRTIAAEVNFTLDPKWNTQSAGRKLIDFLNSATITSPSSVKNEESGASASEHAPKPTPKPAAKPKAQPEVKSANHNTDNELTEEEMNELLKQIAELRKTIESLEARVSTLEGHSTSAATTKKGLTRTISKDYIYSYFGIIYYFVRQSDGKMGYLKPIYSSDYNHTVGQTRKVADMFGYKYDSKTKREMLGFELVSKYGDGEWAFIGKNAVDANGVTYDFIETKLPYNPDYLKFATGQLKGNDKSELEERFTNDPLVVDPKWTPDEIAAKLFEFQNSLIKK